MAAASLEWEQMPHQGNGLAVLTYAKHCLNMGHPSLCAFSLSFLTPTASSEKKFHPGKTLTTARGGEKESPCAVYVAAVDMALCARACVCVCGNANGRKRSLATTTETAG